MSFYLGNAAFNPTSPNLAARKDFGRERERITDCCFSTSAAGVVGVGPSSLVTSRSRSSNFINSTSANVEDLVRQLADSRMLCRSHSIRVSNSLLSLLSMAGMLILTVHCWLMLADSWTDTGLVLIIHRKQRCTTRLFIGTTTVYFMSSSTR